MVHKLPAMVDMARTPKDLAKDPFSPIPLGMLHDRYPCGLSVALDHNDLEKLGMPSDPEIGEMMHGYFFAKVTGVSRRDGLSGEECRIEMQITHLSVENEDEENEEEEERDEGGGEEEERERKPAFGGRGY